MIEVSLHSKKLEVDDIYPGYKGVKAKARKMADTLLDSAGIHRYVMAKEEESINRVGSEGIKSALFGYKVVTPDNRRLYAVIRSVEGELGIVPSLYEETITGIKKIKVSLKQPRSLLAKIVKKKAQTDKEKVIEQPAVVQFPKKKPSELTKGKPIKEDPEVAAIYDNIQKNESALSDIQLSLSESQKKIVDAYADRKKALEDRRVELIDELMKKGEQASKVLVDLGDKLGAFEAARIRATTQYLPGTETRVLEALSEALGDKAAPLIEDIREQNRYILSRIRPEVAIIPKTESEKFSQAAPAEDVEPLLEEMLNSFDSLISELNTMSKEFDTNMSEASGEVLPMFPPEEEADDYAYAQPEAVAARYNRRLVSMWNAGYVDEKEIIGRLRKR